MKKVNTSLLMAITALIPLVALAQAPSIVWQNTIGGNGTDMLSRLIKSGSGYLAAGTSVSGPLGDKTENSLTFDYWITRLDQNGNVIWDNTISGNMADWLTCAQKTSDGGYILGGKSLSGISGDKTANCNGGEDYWIVKVDQNGIVSWDKTIGSSSDDYLNEIKQTADGGYILGGYSPANQSGDKSQNSDGTFDYWVVKLNQSGTIMWDKTIGAHGCDLLVSIVQTSDGGYLLGGSSNSMKSGDKTGKIIGGYDYWFVKIDQNGNIKWDNTIGGTGDDWLRSIQKVSDGYILGGYSNSGISGNKTEACQGEYDYWLVKIGLNGIIQWDKTIGGNAEDELYSLAKTNDGGFLLGGYSESNASGDKTENSRGDYDYWVVKLDANANVVWDKTIGGIGLDELFSAEQANDGGYILGGYSESGISGDKTEANFGYSDYWVIKLGPDPQRVSPEILPSTTDESWFTAKIYPNPTSGIFRITLAEPLETNATVTISNMLGQIVYSQEFSSEDFNQSQIISLDNEITEGPYFVRIVSGHDVFTRQILLQR